jgi:16S rRNA (guanine966-N2)-methyltransferase
MANSNEVRIIAGQWRGRKIRFPAGSSIRPTPDRVRETLFNWLAPVTRGAQVLDAFAGSGALGLESASREAASVVCLETDGRCVVALQDHCRAWGATQVEVIRADALRWLAAERPSTRASFDLVFLDPPFDADLWSPIAQRLEAGHWLSPQAFVYLEMPAAHALADLPPNWKPWREGRAGEVGYHLLRRHSEGGEPS